jgi:hypothetical protein
VVAFSQLQLQPLGQAFAKRHIPTAPMLAELKSERQDKTRPAAVAAAMALLCMDALFGAVSPHVLFHLSPSSNGWALPFQPGVWVLALLQVLFALLIWRGKGWLRYLLACWAVYLLADYVFLSDLRARFESFPFATSRDILSMALLVTSAVLLFLPASTRWFTSKRAPSNART